MITQEKPSQSSPKELGASDSQLIREAEGIMNSGAIGIKVLI